MKVSMAMNNFCVFILTHGRPDRVYTYKTLMDAGYTGKVYIVIDDEDDAADQYYEKYGDKVLMFSKAEIAKTFDEGDNFDDRRVIIYARNACFQLAEQVGCRYFLQLDDDYIKFDYRVGADNSFPIGRTKTRANIEQAIFKFLKYFISVKQFTSIAMAQGGDFIGGLRQETTIRSKRKAMNTLFCDTERPFQFVGRINEDVNTYTSKQRAGSVFLTPYVMCVTQQETQANAGGMSDVYVESGTYLKSFYSVMYCPSSVKVDMMRDRKDARIHHRVKWDATAPMIIREEHKK